MPRSLGAAARLDDGWGLRPNVALGACDAPNVAFGASDAPNVALGRTGGRLWSDGSRKVREGNPEGL
ncbi:hypothetical protein GCM10009565_13290 [Amycolatopsis albidoflavus]